MSLPLVNKPGAAGQTRMCCVLLDLLRMGSVNKDTGVPFENMPQTLNFVMQAIVSRADNVEVVAALNVLSEDPDVSYGDLMSKIKPKQDTSDTGDDDSDTHSDVESDDEETQFEKPPRAAAAATPKPPPPPPHACLFPANALSSQHCEECEKCVVHKHHQQQQTAQACQGSRRGGERGKRKDP